MSNGHSGTVFRVLCQKLSTDLEKLAPIDWHDWHVFATLAGRAALYFLLVYNKDSRIGQSPPISAAIKVFSAQDLAS